MHVFARVLTVLTLSLVGLSVQAYSGPGSGISFFSALISVLVSIVVVIGAILAWPVRAWLKRRRKQRALRDSAAP